MYLSPVSLPNIVMALLMITLSVPSWAEGRSAPLHLTLKQALILANQRTVDVITANERVQQALARIGQARSVLLPQLTGNVNEQRETINLNAVGINIPGQGGVVGPFNSFDARIKLAQTLFDYSAVSRLKSAREGYHLSEEQSRKAKQDAMALVGTFYIEAKRAQDAIVLAKALVRRDSENLRLVRTQFDIGTGTDVAVKQAAAQLADSKHILDKASAESIERRLDLVAALGISTDQLIQYDEGNLFHDHSIPEEKKVVEQSGNHPDVAIAQVVVKQRGEEQKTELSEYLPKLLGTGDVGRTGNQIYNTDTTYTLGLQIKVPVFDSGFKSSRYREATSRQRESDATLKDVKHRVEAGAISAREVLKQTRTQVEAAKAQLTYAAKDRQLVQERNAIGIATDLDLTRAMANEAYARDGQFEAVAAYHMAQINLAHAMGNVGALIEKEVY